MFALRRSTVLADTRLHPIHPIPTRPLSLVRVGADPTKSWTTPDSNGKSWQISDHEDSVPAGQRFEGSTDEYPETTYKFYEPTLEALTATIEKAAKSQAASSTSTFSVGESADETAAIDAGIGDLASFSSTVETEEGPITTDAETTRLMADEGISHDAAVDRQVKKKAATSTSKAPPTASGAAALKVIQAALIKLGYDLGSYGADGKIGPYTRGAITKFKKDHGLTPANSTIDAAFRKALADATAGGGAPSTPTAAAAAGGIGTTGIVIAVVAAVAAVVAFFVLKK